MQIAVLGIDLGKNSCSIVGFDDGGAVVLRRRMRREGVIKLAGKLRPCVVAMEACCGAHHLGRVLRAQGHEVRLMSPEYVRPYVKSQKNDDRDAEAIAEAATRPTMRFVELKSEEQLVMQTLQPGSRSIGGRTNRIDQSAAGGAVGTRHHGCARPAQTREASRGLGRTGRSQPKNARADRRHAAAMVRVGPPHCGTRQRAY